MERLPEREEGIAMTPSTQLTGYQLVLKNLD
jgi:hypothetical protein